MASINLSIEDLNKMGEIASKDNTSKDELKKCLYDIEKAISDCPFDIRILTTYQAVRFKLVEIYEAKFGEYKPQFKNTVSCKINFKRNNVVYSSYFKELKRSNIDYLNKRNSNKNIVRKVELIKEAENGDLSLLDKYDKYGILNDNDYGFLENLINDLKEIQKVRKIKISKDFNYKIEVIPCE